MESPVMTVRELADYLRVHPSTIYRLLKQKRIPAFKLGREWRFNRESVDRWLLEQRKMISRRRNSRLPTEGRIANETEGVPHRANRRMPAAQAHYLLTPIHTAS
jgi:excisionase family DNA binding protein